MRIIGAGDDTIALRPGVNVGARDPYGILIRQIGPSRLGAFYHATRNVVVSGSNLVSWDDVRGPTGFGPTLLPNGGSGGTAPTVSGGTVNTNGSSSYIANASAVALFALNNKAMSLVVWGEMTGTPSYWGGLADSVASPGDYDLFQPNGSNKVQFFSNGSVQPTNAKVQPGAGVRSMFIMTRNTKYPWESSSYYTFRGEWVGRGMAFVGNTGEHANSTAFLTLGRIASYYGAMKIRGIAFITAALTARDKAALESFMTDPLIGDAVSLYDASDSTGIVHMTGDSLTFGAGATTGSTTTPVNPSATNYPAKVQALLNSNGKAIDTMNTGVPSESIADFVTLQSGQTSTYLADVVASLSQARRAKGLAEVMVLWMGTNDIAGGASASQLETNLATAVATIKAAGGKVALCTIIPRGGWYTTASETTRLAVNTWLRANTVGADLVIDLSLVPDGATLFLRDPSGGSDAITNNATYYNADAVHMTDLGYSRIGTYVYNALAAAALV